MCHACAYVACDMAATSVKMMMWRLCGSHMAEPRWNRAGGAPARGLPATGGTTAASEGVKRERGVWGVEGAPFGHLKTWRWPAARCRAVVRCGSPVARRSSGSPARARRAPEQRGSDDAGAAVKVARESSVMRQSTNGASVAGGGNTQNSGATRREGLSGWRHWIEGRRAHLRLPL